MRCRWSPISQVNRCGEGRQLAEDLTVQHQFSVKPGGTGQYRDYHHKVSTYVSFFSRQRSPSMPQSLHGLPLLRFLSRKIPRSNTAIPATTRAGIGSIAARFLRQRVAIVGVGEPAHSYWTWCRRRQ